MRIPLVNRLKQATTRPVVEKSAVEVMEHEIIKIFIPASFDENWYRRQYPALSSSDLTPWEHFDQIGWKLGLDPSQYFWSSWYLAANGDVANANVNPLVHYELSGAAEGRRPSLLFDAQWYAAHYGIDKTKVLPLAHYLWLGAQKGFAPRPEAIGGTFQAEGVTSKHRSLWLQNLPDRVVRPGTTAYHEASLRGGRSAFSLRGDKLLDNSTLEHIAEQIKQKGVDITPPYFVSAREVYVVPGSSSLIFDEIIVNDEIATKPLNDVSAGREKVEGTRRKNDHLTIRYKSELSPRISRGIHLFKEYEQNYFHFLTELMPKLHLLEQTAIDPSIPLLVSDDLDQRLYSVIDHLRHSQRPVLKLKRDVPHMVEELLYLSDVALIKDVYNAEPLSSHLFLPADVIAGISNKIKDHVVKGHRRLRKLYVSRRSERRRLLNDAAIAEKLIEHDFDLVVPEDLSFGSQVEIFSSAELIVGATGAAFTNIMWCRPGTQIVIMYPDHPYNNTTFWDELGRITKADISYVNGKRAQNVQGVYSMHDDFVVDLDHLMAVLA